MSERICIIWEQKTGDGIRSSVDGEASGAGLCEKTVFKKSREDFKKRAFVRKTL